MVRVWHRKSAGGSSNASVDSSDDSNNEKTLPIRQRRAHTPTESSDQEKGAIPEEDDEPRPNLAIHPFPTRDGLIVSIQPPREPVESLKEHVPCDIVLVIDVSGSMGSDAPVPGNPGETKEKYGLSVLDLTKHAAKTILETLNPNDRLGIVTFASDAKVSHLLHVGTAEDDVNMVQQVVQKLTPMNSNNKRNTRKKIEAMVTRDITNLWGGIQTGLKLFDTGSRSCNGKVPALMVLTDGMPNHM